MRGSGSHWTHRSSVHWEPEPARSSGVVGAIDERYSTCVATKSLSSSMQLRGREGNCWTLGGMVQNLPETKNLGTLGPDWTSVLYYKAEVARRKACEEGSELVDAVRRVIQEVLRALTREEKTVIKQETAREMPDPQLNEAQKAWLKTIAWTYGSTSGVPEGKTSRPQLVPVII
ncbi:hypothetical protein VTH82DRAFT_1409 [Thermothelomyces myriococcoides]